MSLRTKKVMYIIYLIALPVLLICIERIYKLADIYTSRTYTPLNIYVGFFLYIIAGIVIGADIFFAKNSGLRRNRLRLYKLLDAVLLMALYVAFLFGIFYIPPAFLNLRIFLIAAGFQIITAFCPLTGAERHT